MSPVFHIYIYVHYYILWHLHVYTISKYAFYYNSVIAHFDQIQDLIPFLIGSDILDKI